MLWFQDKIVVFVRVQDFDNRSSVAGGLEAVSDEIPKIMLPLSKVIVHINRGYPRHCGSIFQLGNPSGCLKCCWKQLLCIGEGEWVDHVNDQ